jgi:hypothetical protein
MGKIILPGQENKAATPAKQPTIDVAADMDEIKYREQDRYWCQKIGHELVSLYPGHGWEVEVNIKQGICDIFNRHMRSNAGYRLKLSDLNHIRLRRQMKKIGGEILERFYLNRERFKADEVRELQQGGARAKVDLS